MGTCFDKNYIIRVKYQEFQNDITIINNKKLDDLTIEEFFFGNIQVVRRAC